VPRVKRGTKRAARRKKILTRAKGYFLTKSKLHRSAKESVDRALAFAFRDRRAKKRTFRSLWIVRIGAAAKANAISYNKFIHGLKLAGIGGAGRNVVAHLATLREAGNPALAGIEFAAQLARLASVFWLKAPSGGSVFAARHRLTELLCTGCLT